MATSHYQGHCRTSALEDDNRDDAVIMSRTASVTPLAVNIPSTPPRVKQLFGLVTPPDSRPRPNLFGIHPTSPPRTPVRRFDVPKDTESLTVSENSSERSSNQSTTNPCWPPPGLLTPDNTPPRLSKPRFVPVSHKQESEFSLSLQTTSAVVEISEIFKHHAEIVQDSRKSEPVTTQCNGIKPIRAPDFYLIPHIDQYTSLPPSNSFVNVRASQYRQSQDIATRPITYVNSQYHGLTLRCDQCQRSVESPTQYCFQHGPKSPDTPTILTAPKSSQCRGLTLRGVQCSRSVKLPAQYCFQHDSQDPNAPVIVTAPKSSQCRGLTLRGVQCSRSVKLPAQYCFQHDSQDPNTLVIVTTPKSSQCLGLTLRGVQCSRSVILPAQYCFQHDSQDPNTLAILTAPKSLQCCGLTLRGVQCSRSVKFPAQYCFQHDSQSVNTPTAPTAPKPVTYVNSQCHGLTLRGVQCRRSVNPPAQYCYQHGSQSNNIPSTTPITPTLAIEVNSRCLGLTQGGIQCQPSVKSPTQYCHQHEYQINNTPATPIAPQPTTEVNLQRRRSVEPPAQYRHEHEYQGNNTPTTPIAPTLTTEVNSRCHGLTLLGGIQPVTDVNSSSPCRELTLRTVQCERSVKPSTQYRHQHRPQSDVVPTPPAISTIRITAQCNAKSNPKGCRCQQWVSIAPSQLTNDTSQPIYCHIPALVGIVKHIDNEGFKVQLAGQEDIFVRFCDYIPEYLQRDTQQNLRKAMTRNLSERSKIPGYVYALNVFDPENEEKLSLKIGYSKDVKKRHAEWKNKCRSSIKDVRGWWPQTIIEAKDDDELAIQKLIRNNCQGDKGPMAEQLERLVHIELKDLATHAAYLHPNFPDVHFSDIPRQPKVELKPCRDCNGTKHKEVFSFTRVKEGEFFGREWEDIVKPVIRKWGLFLKTYFAQGLRFISNLLRRCVDCS